MSEQYSVRRKLAAAGFALLGGTTLAGCSSEPVDYSGIGNEFTVRGIVSDSESDGLVQVQEDDIVVINTAGKAEDWFTDNNGVDFLSDEYDFLQRYSEEPGGWFSCGDDVYVGEVFDQNGQQIQPEDLEPGDVVEIQGRIRQSQYWQSSGKSGYCNEEDLAVYDMVTIVDGTLG